MSVAAVAPPSSRAMRWLPMLFIGLGISMVIMDATIVNVSLPSIIRELEIGSIDAEWINAIYSLVFAALLIIAGRLGDRVGRRLVFMLGAVVFGVASIVAARTGSGGTEESSQRQSPSLRRIARRRIATAASASRRPIGLGVSRCPRRSHRNQSRGQTWSCNGNGGRR